MPPDSGADAEEPPRLRALRRLVTLLTLTLAVGIATITGLLAWRLTTLPSGEIAAPTDIPLPEGERLTGFAVAEAWLVLITADAEGVERVHFLPPDGSAIVRTIRLDP